MWSSDQEASTLVMFLENLDQASVCKNAPMNHQQKLAMEIHKALVYRV